MSELTPEQAVKRLLNEVNAIKHITIDDEPFNLGRDIEIVVADWHRLTAEVARLQGVIDTAWDGHGSDVFDILEEGISAILLEKEKGPQP